MQQKREWLQRIRLAKKLTHEEVARAAGIQRAYFTMIESGYRDPSVDVAKKIAVVLGFKWPIFFEDQCNETQLKVQRSV